ncbi:MAG TPA: hypothetical protein VH370_08910 [Humisphaera sp.]|jgi:hypothetical protein|nr:hypothetical protein [Humisphaera sp.]
MRLIVALFAIVGLLGFAGFTQAADPKTGPSAPHKGIFEKVDKADSGKQSIYYKGGAKGTGQQWYLAVDDKATVTIDGKEAKLADLKAGQVLTFTVTKEVIMKVVAETPKEAPPASGK